VKVKENGWSVCYFKENEKKEIRVMTLMKGRELF
jgi:hypothetical protein